MRNIFIILLFLIPKMLGMNNEDASFRLDIKELGIMDIQTYSLLTPDGSCICSLNTTQGSHLAIFDSSTFDAIDKSEMPLEVTHLIAGVKAIKTKYDLNSVVMIGDLYVSLAHRGKGYAHHLLEKTCTHLFSKDSKTIVLIPNPFELENGHQKPLSDENKKQKLIKLYQHCGFKKDVEDTAAFMYRNITNS